MSERAVFAKRGYEAGRRAERLATADWLGGLAEAVADIVVISYLDGREHAGEELDDYDEERVARVQDLHKRAASAYRVLFDEWQRTSRRVET